MKNRYHAILSKAKNEFENKNYEKSITELESFVNNQNIIINPSCNEKPRSKLRGIGLE